MIRFDGVAGETADSGVPISRNEEAHGMPFSKDHSDHCALLQIEADLHAIRSTLELLETQLRYVFGNQREIIEASVANALEADRQKVAKQITGTGKEKR